MPGFPRACLLNRNLPRESNPDVSSWWTFEPDSASSRLHSFYQMFSRPSIREIRIRWGRPGVSNPTNDRSTSCLILHTFLLGTFGRPLARDAEVGLNAEERRGFSSRLTRFTPTHPVSLFSAPIVFRDIAEPRWVPNGKQPTTGRPRDLSSLTARELAEIRDIIPDETAVMGANGVFRPW
jgi:hypothetical protein